MNARVGSILNQDGFMIDPGFHKESVNKDFSIEEKSLVQETKGISVLSGKHFPSFEHKEMSSLHRHAVHVMGISGTKLEGNVFSRSIDGMRDFLGSYAGESSNSSKADIAGDTYRAFGSLASLSKEIERIELESPSERASSLEELSQKIESRVEELEVGEKFVIPGGTCAHAMLYEVQKKEDGSLTFTVVNTGMGLKKHHKKQTDPKTGKVKYDPSYVRENIGKNSLKKAFFKELIGLQVNEGSCVDDIYRLSEEKGEESTEVKSFQECISPQKIDTCTHKVLGAYLKMEYCRRDTVSNFKKLKVISKVQTFKNLLNVDKGCRVDGVRGNILGGSLVRRNAHRELIALAAETIAKLYEGEGEKLEEMGFGENEINEIYSLIQEGREKYPLGPESMEKLHGLVSQDKERVPKGRMSIYSLYFPMGLKNYVALKNRGGKSFYLSTGRGELTSRSRSEEGRKDENKIQKTWWSGQGVSPSKLDERGGKNLTDKILQEKEEILLREAEAKRRVDHSS